MSKYNLKVPLQAEHFWEMTVLFKTVWGYILFKILSHKVRKEVPFLCLKADLALNFRVSWIFCFGLYLQEWVLWAILNISSGLMVPLSSLQNWSSIQLAQMRKLKWFVILLLYPKCLHAVRKARSQIPLWVYNKVKRSFITKLLGSRGNVKV